MIEVKCPHCGRVSRAPDDAAGKSAKCAGCQQVVIIPGATSEPTNQPAPSPMISGAGDPSAGAKGTIAPSVKKKRTYTFFEGRPYIHTACGETTIVNEEHFAGLCNPFRPVAGTMCCNCNEAFPCKEFRWEDTGEPLDEYRKRLREKAPASIQRLPGAGAAIGAVFMILPNLRGFGVGTLVAGVIGAAGGWIGARFLAAYLESETEYFKIP